MYPNHTSPSLAPVGLLPELLLGPASNTGLRNLGSNSCPKLAEFTMIKKGCGNVPDERSLEMGAGDGRAHQVRR